MGPSEAIQNGEFSIAKWNDQSRMCQSRKPAIMEAKGDPCPWLKVGSPGSSWQVQWDSWSMWTWTRCGKYSVSKKHTSEPTQKKPWADLMEF